MATFNGKYKVKNSQNSYDIIHLETSANQVKFEDGSNFQDKLDQGLLKGEQGPKGEQGIQGPKGEDGLTTSVTVNGVKYSHSNGNINLPSYPTLSSLGAESTTGSQTKADKAKNDAIASAKSYADEKLALKSDIHSHPYKFSSYVPDWNEITSKPIIPTKLSELNNDAYYATEDYVIEQIANLGGGGGGFGTEVTLSTTTSTDFDISFGNDVNIDFNYNTTGTNQAGKLEIRINGIVTEAGRIKAGNHSYNITIFIIISYKSFFLNLAIYFVIIW